ncbi:hypothetical protein [Mycobacterium deserti]|uniref:HTTM domain-containing protein n=1 Tax=Mycobacterium deserti TaxID=2978347 RepID=A0ABT2M5C5_9MYCO|nr:hypothetical protein [Mycobacterium deserti]MCT7656844.1 hypothetical protein [Mycobacterium deserti]
MSAASRAIDRWRIGRGYTQTSESLAIYRILFALTTLFILGPGRLGVGVTSGEVGGAPAGMFHPPLGPAILLTTWPSAGVILAVELLLVASLGAILVGAFTRTASLSAATCGLVLTSLLYSEGKIDHTILWTVLVPALMAWTSWGDTWSVDAGRERVRQREGFQSDACLPIAGMAVALGIVFAGAATVKVLTGWLDPGTSASLGWAFAHGVQIGFGAEPPLPLPATPTVVWLVIDYATVIFEFGMLIAAMRRDWMAPYLFGAAALFHSGAALVGFPAFFEIIVVYLLFVRYDAVARRFSRPLGAFGRLAARRPVLVCAVAASVLALYSLAALRVGAPLTVVLVLAFVGVPAVALWPMVVAISAGVYAKRLLEPVDRSGNTLPAWAFPTAAAVVAAHISVILAVSEPYPSLMGPSFMGTFDDGRAINVAEQRFWVVDNGRRSEVAPSSVLIPSRGGAVQLGSVRFPGPNLDSSGRVIANPSLPDRLSNFYHHFSSKHLRDYGGPLSDAEKAWIRMNLAAHHVPCDRNCSLDVEWRRLSFDRTTGERLLEETVDRRSYTLH